MPVYDYQCDACHTVEERVVRIFNSDEFCTKCGGPLLRLFSPPGQVADNPVLGPTRSELWEAYKDHKIRFTADDNPLSPTYGNDITINVVTGERIPSEKFSNEDLRRSYGAPPVKLDKDGRQIRRERTGKRIWPETEKKFF